MAPRSEFLQVAEWILRREQKPLSPKEITDIARAEGIFSDRIAGKTPAQTMKSKLSVHVRRLGKNSSFLRTQPGRFFLRDLLAAGQSEYLARPIEKSYTGERIVVTPQDILPGHRRFQGIDRRWQKYLARLNSSGSITIMDRLAAEGNDAVKQLLTYIQVCRGKEVLAFRRGNYNLAAQSLRGSLCIGFGGHIAEHDLDLFGRESHGIFNCAYRELNEELSLPDEDRKRLLEGEGLEIVGVLNDDSTPLGRRHLAFVMRYRPSNDPYWERPERGEKSITQLQWITASQGVFRIWDFEYWSQLALKVYYPQLVPSVAAYRIRRRSPFRAPHMLCLVGRVGSGKSEVARVLEKDFGYSVVNSGEVLAGLLGLEPVPVTAREVFQEAALRFIRKRDGPSRLAEGLFARALEAGRGSVVIDGIRHLATLDALRSAATGWTTPILFVHTMPDVALEMFSEREMPHATLSDYLARARHPVETQIDDFLDRADAIIYNWKGKRELRQIVHALLAECEVR